MFTSSQAHYNYQYSIAMYPCELLAAFQTLNLPQAYTRGHGHGG
jgi:hypothetical protein